ncbi:net [Carabus blaptoides fortunei]
MTDSLEMSAKTTNAEATISSFILKGTSASTADRDAGFCSGGDEDDLEMEDDIHSPTDASEDSVEVKVTPISSRNKNKRKCAEPRKVPNDDIASGPLKKRIRYEVKQESHVDAGRQSPFRPWSIPSRPVPNTTIISSQTPSPPPASFHPVYGYQHPQACGLQEEPLSLVKTRDESTRQCRVQEENCGEGTSNSSVSDMLIIRPKEFAKIPIKLEPSPRVPPHPAVRPTTASEMDDLVLPPKTSPGFTVESLLSAQASTSSSSSKGKCAVKDHQKEQRNYKNMTRERRIEANARERTRVHTISAAFDTLRRSIPAYSHNQKLSKLSVLRIACSYILTLSRVAGNDYSADQTAPTLASCVDLVSRTIQTEGKLRKKKDE